MLSIPIFLSFPSRSFEPYRKEIKDLTASPCMPYIYATPGPGDRYATVLNISLSAGSQTPEELLKSFEIFRSESEACKAKTSTVPVAFSFHPLAGYIRSFQGPFPSVKALQLMLVGLEIFCCPLNHRIFLLYGKPSYLGFPPVHQFLVHPCFRKARSFSGLHLGPLQPPSQLPVIMAP